MTTIQMPQRFWYLYESVFGKGAQIESLPGAGSDRRYFRLLCDGNPSVVATVGDNLQENKAFVWACRRLLGRMA